MKPDRRDFGVIHSRQPANAAGLFTRNNFPGHAVTVGREHLASGSLQTIIVNSGNANVATGPAGLELARECCALTAEALKIKAEAVLPSSTGVIARALPAELMRNACRSIPEHITTDDFASFADAIRTTDAYVKTHNLELMSGIRITGVAKGAGMIQPDMATMLAYLLTDAKIETEDLKRMLRAVADRSFNRLSVVADSLKKDTLVSMANGSSGVKVVFPEEAERAFYEFHYPIRNDELAALPGMDGHSREFLSGLLETCIVLTRLIAADGEGATRLIELRIRGARDREQALKFGRSIINSPLVKTAIYGADPNWGRLIMALGKVYDEPIPLEGVRIFFGDYELKTDEPDNLKIVSNYLKQSEVLLTIELGQGQSQETLWGCDLTEDYVRLNSMYTT